MKDNRLKQLFRILDEMEVYVRALGKISFDMQCIAPPEGMERAGEDMAVLGQRLHKLTHSKKYVELVNSLHADPGDATPVQRRVIRLLWENWAKIKNQTAKYAYEKDVALNRAYAAWLEAKQKSDFSLFRDSLQDVVTYTRSDIDLRDEKKSTYYNSCLDDFEKGGSEEQLDAFFGALKARIVPLMRRVTAEGKPIRSDFLTRPCPIPEQEAFSRYLLELEGLRPTALVLMTTEHPFTTNFGPTDVRVTTHYHEDAFISNVFTTLHEGGHALFMQNEPEEFYKNHLSDSMSCAMHECTSRFFENIIGRSEAFIRFVYPKLREVSPSVMEGVSQRELYEAVNIAAPGLIRTEADELTYSIHILIRYEIEKELVNGRVTVDEVPVLWNAKYKEYLGVDVPDDARGCLQDVHWSGNFGYFPSYALGNAYGAQILRTMEKDFDVFAAVERGELSKVADWLRERVFSIASLMDPDDWVRAITGEGLNPDYFLDNLEKKYAAIYDLK